MRRAELVMRNARAYILINVTLGTMDDVLDALKQLPHVTEAYLLYGNYDIVAQVTAESITKLRELITRTIRRLPHVQSTQTLIVIM